LRFTRDHNGQERSSEIHNLQSFIAFGDKPELEFIAIGATALHTSIVASTINFLEEYKEAVHLKLNEIHPMANMMRKITAEYADRGKPLVFLAAGIEVAQIGQDGTSQIGFYDIQPGMSIAITGEMYVVSTGEQTAETMNTTVVQVEQKDQGDDAITIIEGEDAIYVAFDRYRHLEKTLEMYDLQYNNKPTNDLYLYHHYIKQSSQPIHNEPLVPDIIVEPNNTPMPDREYDGYEPEL
jgi:hypothetical protein